MKTTQLTVQFPQGPAHLSVEDGCGEIRVTGFAPLEAVKELRERLGIQPQFMGAWDCKDGTAAIDYRVPISSFYLREADKPTVRSVVKSLGIRWSERLVTA